MEGRARGISRTGGALKAALALTLALGMSPAVPYALAEEAQAPEEESSAVVAEVRGAVNSGALSQTTPAASEREANEYSPIEVGSADDLIEAMNNPEGKIIVLIDDIELGEGQHLSFSGDSAIDLNNFSITSNGVEIGSLVSVQSGGSLLVTDDSTEGGGSISGSARSGTIVNSGKLTVDAGIVENVASGHAILVSKSGDETPVLNIQGTAKAQSAGVTVQAQLGEVHVGGNASIVSTGESGSAISALGSSVSLGGDAVLEGDSGVMMTNLSDKFVINNVEGTKSSSLEMTGGEIKAATYGVTGNNLQSAQCSACISGGSISSENAAAIYWPMEGALTISGGTISGKTALEAKMGTIEITGGAFSADEEFEAAYSGDGTVADGSAIKLVGQIYGSSQTNPQFIEDSGLHVSITGGQFTSANGNAVSIYNNGTEQDSKGKALVCNVTVGPNAVLTTKTAVRDAIRFVTTKPQIDVDADRGTVANGNTTITNGDLANAAAVVTTQALTSASSSVSTTTLCTSVQSALEVAGKTDQPTVTLMRDVTEDISIADGTNATINFNSHTLAGTITNEGDLKLVGDGRLIGQVNSVGESPADIPDGITVEIARIGDTTFDSLAGAISAAKAGKTIFLLGDVYCEPFTLPAGVTLDGQGNSVNLTGNSSSSSSFITIASANGVAIKNVTVNAGNAINHGIQYYCSDNGTLDNVTINGGKGTALMVNGSDVAAANCTFNPDSENGAWANIEYGVGSGVTTVPSLKISGTTKYNAGEPFVYVDVREGQTLDRIKANVTELANATPGQVAEWLNKNKLEGVYFQVDANGNMGAAEPGEKPETPDRPVPRPPSRASTSRSTSL